MRHSPGCRSVTRSARAPFREEHLATLLALPWGQLTRRAAHPWHLLGVRPRHQHRLPPQPVPAAHKRLLLRQREGKIPVDMLVSSGGRGRSQRQVPTLENPREREKKWCPMAWLAPGLLVTWAGPRRRGPGTLPSGGVLTHGSQVAAARHTVLGTKPT